MHIDESLLAHVAETRQFNEQYLAAMAASPLGFATAEDALRTREILDENLRDVDPQLSTLENLNYEENYAAALADQAQIRYHSSTIRDHIEAPTRGPEHVITNSKNRIH